MTIIFFIFWITLDVLLIMQEDSELKFLGYSFVLLSWLWREWNLTLIDIAIMGF